MTESRIQDWIRYVQERAENVPPDEETEPVLSNETVATETIRRGPHDSARSARLGAAVESRVERRSERMETETAPPPAESLRPPSAAVARASSRIKRVAAAGGRNLAPPTTTEPLLHSAADDEHAITPSGAIDAPSVRVATVSTRTASNRTTSTREPATRTAALLDAARGSSSAAAPRQRVRQRPETRTEMLERLTNPTISLYEASVLLDVCSATVRRYTNSGLLPHARTEGGQRRFRLHDVLALVREMESAKKQ